MAVLVTGGAGYIGSHTCVELMGAGHNVIILDNFSNSKAETAERIGQIAGCAPTVYEADLLNRSDLDKLFSMHDISSVVHFAGFKAVGESVELPLIYYKNNIAGTLNLCETMREHGCRSLVFSSSATVYGQSLDVPFHEDSPLSATNPYGWTKLMIEQILRDLHASDPEWAISILRYFNPVGAHKSGVIGEDSHGIPNNLAPYIAQVAAGKLPCLNVFGGDYDTPDGTGVRDYLHVVDLAVGHLRALEYVTRQKGVQAINLGTGVGTSVLEMVAAFERASGVSIQYKIQPRRPGDIATCYADPSKAKELLGWTAQRGIDEMCADHWAFVKKNA